MPQPTLAIEGARHNVRLRAGDQDEGYISRLILADHEEHHEGVAQWCSHEPCRWADENPAGPDDGHECAAHCDLQHCPVDCDGTCCESKHVEPAAVDKMREALNALSEACKPIIAARKPLPDLSAKR